MMDPKLRNILKMLRKYNPEKIIVFGSAAKGISDSYSDIDLIIIKRTQKRFLDRIQEVIKIIKPNHAIDILVYTPEELRKMVSENNAFIKHILEEGKVIYERA